MGIMNRTYSSTNNQIVSGFAGGNGGFLLEPILYADRTVHVALPVVFGGGFVDAICVYWQRILGKG